MIDVVPGCSNQAGEDSRNIARNSVLAAGLHGTIPGETVNRVVSLCIGMGQGMAVVLENV